ncbi:MAG TPA: hypothetical protein VEC19_12165 [Usitatibacter sp.]|nr:hypothetical protein [Usitatibacter sp.]
MRLVVVVTLMVLAYPLEAAAQARQDPGPLLAAQQQAMAPLKYMDGVWRGPAWTLTPGGKHEIVQTERIGPFLNGTIKVIEGRGYGADGKVTFNALGIVSFDPAKKAYSMRSYAMGHSGDFPVTLRADGFNWEIPAGPGKIVYTATVKDNVWHEVGDRVMPGQVPQRFFEMKLQRVGDSDWPAAGAVPAK